MKNKKKIMIVVLICFVCFIGTCCFFIRKKLNNYNDCLYRNFSNFISYLHKTNRDLSNILVLDEIPYDLKVKYNEESESMMNPYDELMMTYDSLIDRDVFNDFFSKYSRRIKLFDIMYDDEISNDERKYINTLYSYNKELIDMYEESFGTYEQRSKNIKVIIGFYKKFYKNANTLLEEKYSLLNEFQESYSPVENIKPEEAENVCEEVIEKIFDTEVNVDYQEKHQYNYEEYNMDADRTIKKDNEHYIVSVDYIVRYNIIDDQIYLGATYTLNSKGENIQNVNSGEIFNEVFGIKNEKEIDKIAEMVITRIGDNNLINYDKYISYGDDGENIDYKYYYFIKKENNIYDETKKITMNINKNGIIEQLWVYNLDDFNNVKKPILSETDILSKIDKNYSIKDCLLIRNYKGELEYEVHVELGEENYAIVFDANSGEQKYFGEKTRKYNSE